MKVTEKLEERVGSVDSLVCVGLDSNVEKLPGKFLKRKQPQFEFNKWIVEQTHEYVCAYKSNIAFYEARGGQGWRELKLTMDYIQSEFPEVVTICDAKRADIGSTNEGYVKAIFDELGFDAITLHPYLGREALEPFLERGDKACIILCRTSNPGARELQDLDVGDKKVWEVVAEKVRDDWNEKGNCMLVIGATYPKELAKVRGTVGDMTLLVPGVGAQGGDVKKAVKAGLNSDSKGMIINSSRGIIFSEDPADAASKLRNEINKYR